MEYEGIEQEILLEPENAVVGAVYSVNGKTGDVVLTTSDLENDSDYQTGDEVDAAIATAIAGKQDTLTAGNNIQISDENVISATDTTYSAGNGLNLSSENAFSVDTTVVATQQNLATEVQNRENADNALQAQIDGISASSDVVDIVGTYADLQNYDTQHLKDNDIIKVLQDETQNNATTYYRWSTTTETFTLIGQEGPYYTKAAADAQFVPQTRTVNGKALSSNITLNASDVSALGTADVVQTTGSSTSQVMSQNATTQALGTKLNTADYVVDDELKNSTNPVQNGVLYGLLGNMPTDFFSGNATTEQTGTEAQFTNALKISDIELNGNTFQQTYTGKNLLKMEQRSVASNGITATINSDGSIHITGTATATCADLTLSIISGYDYPVGTQFTFSMAGTAPVNINAFCGGWYGATAGSTSGTGTSTAATTNIYVSSTGYVVNQEYDFTISNLMLEVGSSPTAYEPYVGGTASPNPDYPQDVQVVTGEQTVNVHGKNLFPVTNQDFTVNNVHFYTQNGTLFADGNSTGETYSNNTNWKNNFAFTLPAGTYTVSLDTAFTTCSVKKKSDDSSLATINGTTLKKATFTLSEETEVYLGIYMYQLSLSNLKLPFQVEVGSDATTYESFQGQDYTVELGSIELVKIGTYQDYIYKSGDDWYVHKEIGNITLDGTQTIALTNWRASDTSVGWVYAYNVFNSATIAANSVGAIVSDKLLAASFTSLFDKVQDNGIALYINTDYGLAVRVKDTSLTTSAAINTYLGSNPIDVYYPLATPTDTQITDGTLIGQLNALYNAKMLAGQTNFAVSAVSPNLPAILDITVFNANAQGLISNIRGN